jgi:hypothetical protein
MTRSLSPVQTDNTRAFAVECKARIMRDVVLPLSTLTGTRPTSILADAIAFLQLMDAGVFAANDLDFMCDHSLRVSMFAMTNLICAKASMLLIYPSGDAAPASPSGAPHMEKPAIEN